MLKWYDSKAFFYRVPPNNYDTAPIDIPKNLYTASFPDKFRFTYILTM